MPLVTFSPTQTIKSSEVNANFSGLANGSLMNSPVFASATLNQFIAYGFNNYGNSGATPTINWALADRQTIVVSANTTLAYSNAVAGQVLTLIIKENGTGNFTIALPAGTDWPGGVAGVFTTTPNAINVITVLFDGTNYLTQLAAGFT